MLLQITWSPWIGTPFATDLNLKAAAIIYSRVTQPLEGAGLRVLYLAERVSCQLMGEDMPQVPMDPPLFMLAPLSAMDAKYQLWRNGIPYTKKLLGNLDCDSSMRLVSCLCCI